MTNKIIYIGVFLLFCFQVSFGQTKTENTKGNQGMATGGYKPNRQETPPKTKVTYESRSYQNECYKNFAFTVKNYGYNKDGKFYSWGVTVKNNYSKAVQLKYKLIVGNDNNQNGTLTYYIKPGETYSNDFGTAKAIIVNNNSDQYKIEVSEVCFEGQDCNKNGYVDCNGKQRIARKSNNSNSNNNTTNQTNNSTQQNDLTEYNRSKVEMEQKLAEKNAEIQRQNQENANKLNIWNTAIKAGVDAHNSGNYTEAKNQFTIAINNSTNETNRQNAQNYYNKSVEAEKSQAKIKAVGDLTNATVNLVSYFANRKNALRNSLSQEDGQVLLDIVNSENPADYTQNIIQIFTDLGYSHRKTETKNDMTSITMNNDVNNINDFLMIFINSATKFQNYNKISFSYHRKEKLLQQLASLGSSLKGFKYPEIQGIPPSRREKVQQKRILEEQKKTEAINKIEALKPIETEKVVENTITSKSIIDKYILAIGGIEKLKSVQDISITELDQDNFKNEIKIAYGKYSYICTTSEGKIYLKDVFDGNKGFRSALIHGKLNKFEFSDEVINNRKASQPFKEVFDLQNINFTVGKIEKFNTRDCYSLLDQENSTNGNNAYSFYYYFDLENGLLLGKKYFKNSTPNDINYEFYNNYSNIEGILFPLSRIEFEDNDKENSIKYTITVKLNQGLSKSDFR